MVKVENIDQGSITYYPFLDKKEDITCYEPNIVRKFVNNTQKVDFNLNVSNIDRNGWKKIQEVMSDIFFEPKTDNDIKNSSDIAINTGAYSIGLPFPSQSSGSSKP